jgi:hypothetical protein
MKMPTLFKAWALANLEDTPSRTVAGLPMGYREVDTNPYVDSFAGAWSIRRAIKDTYGANVNGNLPLSRYFGGLISGSVEFPLGDAGPYSAIYKSYGDRSPSSGSTSEATNGPASHRSRARMRCSAAPAPCSRTARSASVLLSAGR